MEDIGHYPHRARTIGLSVLAHVMVVVALIFIADLIRTKPAGQPGPAVGIEIIAMAGLPSPSMAQPADAAASALPDTHQTTPALPEKPATPAITAPRNTAPMMVYGGTSAARSDGVAAHSSSGGGSGIVGMPGSEILHYASFPEACRAMLVTMQRAPDTPANLTIHVTFTASGEVHHAKYHGRASQDAELTGQLTSVLNMCAMYLGTTPSYYQLPPGMELRVPRTGIRFYQPI